MYNLFLIALFPIIIFAFYIYVSDKYEKEPIKLLIVGIIFGAIISVPIGFVEKYLEKFLPSTNNFAQAFYLSFVVAAMTEEIFKFIVLYFLIWRQKNFNEPFDGIIYAVMISLGFAMTENILYVINPQIGGISTAFERAIFSVPAHGFFGVTMGYFFALAKYEPPQKIKYMVYAFLFPIILHGLFNFILLCDIPFVMLLFTVYAVYLWIGGQKKINIHLSNSPFKNKST